MCSSDLFYDKARDADFLIYSGTIDGGIKSIAAQNPDEMAQTLEATAPILTELFELTEAFKHKPFHHFHHLLYMSTLAHLFPLSCFSFPCSIFLLSLVLILHHHLTNKHKKHKKDMIKHYTYHHKHKSKHHLTLPCSITMASRGKTMETHLSFSLPFPLSIFGNHKKK